MEKQLIKILTVGFADTNDTLFIEVCRQVWLNEHGTIYSVDTIGDTIKEVQINKYHLITCILPSAEEERGLFINQLRLLRDITITPIIVFTRNAYTPELKIKVLEEGADDFQICPPTIEEAIASVKSMIRRYTELNSKTEKKVTLVYSRNIVISVEHRRVFLYGKEVELLTKEFDVLCLLMRNPRRVFTYKQIFQEVWGDEYEYSARKNLRNQIERLRKKLKTDDCPLGFIKTVRGVGYSYNP